MTTRKTLNLTPEEKKCWENIRNFRFSPPRRGGGMIRIFWRSAVEAFDCAAFICSCVLAGITAELAHKMKLQEQRVEMTRNDGSPKSWSQLIEGDEKDKDIKKIAREIKDKHRNIWVHPNLDEIVQYVRRMGGIVSSDAEMTVGFASAKALVPLDLTRQLLAKLYAR